MLKCVLLLALLVFDVAEASPPPTATEPSKVVGSLPSPSALAENSSSVDKALAALTTPDAALTFACGTPSECGCCGDLATFPTGIIAFNDLVMLSWHLRETPTSSNWDPCADFGGSPGQIDSHEVAFLGALLGSCTPCPSAGQP